MALPSILSLFHHDALTKHLPSNQTFHQTFSQLPFALLSTHFHLKATQHLCLDPHANELLKLFWSRLQGEQP